MTDYEFVKSIYDNDGCDDKTMTDCKRCPLRGSWCADKSNVRKAKAWLENYEKENSMDGINVTVEEKKVDRKSEYPCYKVSLSGTKRIVLFTKPRSGVVVSTDKNWNSLGLYLESWVESGFIPFHGTIKIEVE